MFIPQIQERFSFWYIVCTQISVKLLLKDYIVFILCLKITSTYHIKKPLNVYSICMTDMHFLSSLN